MAPYARLAVDFATAMTEGDFGHAESMLVPALRQQLDAASLRESFYAMFRGYSEAEPSAVHFDGEFQLEDWPSKLPGDLGWAYVGIEGDDFAEAVTVIVAEFEGSPMIREIIWGRP